MSLSAASNASPRAVRTATLDALLIAAAEPDLDTDTLVLALRAAAGEQGEEPVWALAPAEAAGVVSTGGGRVVFATPELRELVYRRAPLAARLAAHRVLARVLTGDDQRLRRAWHRAAALDGPRAELAADLVEAAEWARGRGAYGDASRAMERAAELCTRDADRAPRLLTAADDAWRAGDPRRTERLVAAADDTGRAGNTRCVGLVVAALSGSEAPTGAGADESAGDARPVGDADESSDVRGTHGVAEAHDGELAGRAELLRGLLQLRAGQSAHARESLVTAARRLAVRDRPSAVRALVRAAEASYLAGDHRRYLAIARQASTLRAAAGRDPDFLVDYLEGIAATFRGRHHQAEAPLRRVIARAPELPGPTGLALASTAGLMLGEDAQALRLATEAAAVARAGGALSSLPQILDGLVQTEMWRGNHTAVVAHATEGLELAGRAGQPTSAGRHQAWLALAAGALGDEETCRTRAAAAIELAAAHGLVLPAAVAQWALALLDLGAGRSAEAAARLRTATGRPASCTGSHAGTGRPGGTHLVVQVVATPHLIEAAAQAGDVHGAREALGILERWAASTGSPDRMALAARCRALLAPEAERFELFAEAVELHRLGISAFETARTRLLYGTALRRGRRPSAAREHLHEAFEVFERAGAPAWAARARAELRAAGEAVASPGTDGGLSRLTPQQRQIALLVAEGATNREVAERLFLSPRTVEHHLRNIFTRLEVRSRVELARHVG